MTHLTVLEAGDDGSSASSGERVTDEEYAAAQPIDDSKTLGSGDTGCSEGWTFPGGPVVSVQGVSAATVGEGKILLVKEDGVPRAAEGSFGREAVSSERSAAEVEDAVAGVTVPALVYAQAARTPEKTAIECGSERVSYSELAASAARIAARLREGGAATDAAVGVWLERSPALVHAALGVMTAGAAYLPLDPRQPAVRVRTMLEDARAEFVITDAAHLADLESASVTAIRVEELVDSADGPRSVPAPFSHDVSDLAYIIYTSGSTGRPKGIEVTHGNLLNLVRWHQDALAVTEHDRASAIASPGFDASVWELWPYLTAGATVTIASEETRLSPEALQEWLVDERVTICFLPTVLAETAVRQEWPADAQLRTMLTGGDTLRVYPRDDLPFELVNNYGPAECTVVTTSGTIESCPYANDLPSIGRPIENVEVHLLDDELQPVPIGAVGEVYVGGAGVARGYRNDPELTAERFIADPSSERAGARLYRTGDLARCRDEGSLDFCGRVDAQTKIRGNRVEPDEVAYHLDLHPGVRASCVVAVPDDADETQLVAYFVPSTPEAPNRTALARFLRNRFPDFMVPASFSALSILPLTPNGKVDRKALVALHESARCSEVQRGLDRPAGTSPAPGSATEDRLAAIVGSLLRVDGINAEDDFFLLGGHSLLAAQLMARIRDGFGAELSLRTVFDHPTIRELALVIDRLAGAAPVGSLGPDASSGG